MVGVGPIGMGVRVGMEASGVGGGGCVGSAVAVGSGEGVGGMDSAVWVMLTITVSATWVKTTFGSRVGSAGAAAPQAESTSAAKVSIPIHAVILVLVFIVSQLPFLYGEIIITDRKNPVADIVKLKKFRIFLFSRQFCSYCFNPLQFQLPLSVHL